jgi:flagellar protein FliL
MIKRKQIIVITAAIALVGAVSGYFLAVNLPIGSPSALASGDGKTSDGEPGGHGAADAGETSAKSAEAASGSKEGDGSESVPANNAYALDPIVTNIALPSDIWIRLELVLDTSGPLDEKIVKQIHQDLFAYFHTLRLSEIQGESAFIDLKSELLSRANIRAERKVRNIYIKTFLFE